MAPVANMEVQSASVETFGLKMTQELDIMFSIACTLQSFNLYFLQILNAYAQKREQFSNILQKVITIVLKMPINLTLNPIKFLN